MISRFSVKKPFTVFVAVIMVLILGTISFVNLQTDLLPSMDLPFIVVATSYPGASPEEVEMAITSPIEQVVATTNNIKNISSISSENSSTVILEFNNDVNMDSAIIEINSGLDLIKGMWDDSVGTPMVIRLNPDMLPVIISTVDIKDMDIAEVSKMVSQKVIPELESVNGVASVQAVGLIEEKVQLTISNEKIDNLNKKILSTIDKGLSEVEEELINAEKEIESGRNKLAQEKVNQNKKLLDSEKAINLGKKQIEDGKIALKEGLSQLNNKRDELSLALENSNDKEEELKLLESSILALGEKANEEQKIQLKVAEEGLEEISKGKIEINEGLNAIDLQLLKLENEEEDLIKAKQEIESNEKQLVEGKALLNREMNKAESELNKGAAALEEGRKEFEAEREKAFESASIEEVITKEMISGILAAQNFSMPAGYISEEGTDYLVKIGDKFKDIKEIEGLLLFDTGIEEVGSVYIDDVINIEIVDNSKDIYTKVNGNDAVVLILQKQSNFSTTEISGMIRDKFDDLTEVDPNMSITALMDQGLYIDIIVDSVLKNIIYGGILAILILILFLRDIKPTIIIAVSIPISIIFAVAMMYFTGVTINVISLAGLALGVGMLVDNSIVVIENIYRLRNEGYSAAKAAVEGAKEVSGAIFASTLTTACVFLPIVFVQGMSRTLFVDMGLTIAYSLFASLIVALTLVPTLGSAMLKKTNNIGSKLFDKIVNTYESLLEWTLNHKAIVMILVVSLLGLSIFLASNMGTSFIPEIDAPQMSLSIELPMGSKWEETTEISNIVMDRLLDMEGIETVGAFQAEIMGGLSGGSSKTNEMSMYIVLNEDERISNVEIQKEINRLTEDLDAVITVDTSNMDMSALGASGIEVLVKGREIDRLREISLDIGKLLTETEGTTNISTGEEEEKTSEMRIVIDKEEAMKNGLTVAQIFSQINESLAKERSVTTLSLDNKDYPVVVVDEDLQSIERKNLSDISIKTNKDGEEVLINLGDLGIISEEKGLSSIKRVSQERYISVTANIDADHNIGLVSRDFEKKLNDYNLPEGYSIELSGENEMINDALRDLIYMLLLAIVFIYLIMVAQFQSLLSPFIVMFTIPLAFTGGLLALAITGFDVSLISMLGFLVLSGVVVNNGIVFVDFTNQLRISGLTKREALLLAGRTRIRPILMTAMTTILGLSTLSIGVGLGSEMLQPLAIVAIGGLAYATILTLFVVPAMYEILNRKDIRQPFNEEEIN